MKAHGREYFAGECCKPFFFPGGKQGVLLVHGFTGCVSHMRPLGEALRDKGYTVMGINLPGHGLDEAAMAQSNWRQWLGAVQEAAAEMRGQCETFTVCGLSMGGLLALLTAADVGAEACVSIAAPMATKNKSVPFAGLLAPFYPRVAGRGHQAFAAQMDFQYDFAYSGFPTKKAADLYHLIRLTRKTLPSVTCPVLCVQSRKDESIWEGSSAHILQNMGARQGKILWLQNAPHTCTISKELPDIVEEMDRFMRQVAAGE